MEFDGDNSDFIGGYRSDSGSTVYVFEDFLIFVTRDGMNRIKYTSLLDVLAPEQKQSKNIEIKYNSGEIIKFYDDNIGNLMALIRFIMRVRDDYK